MDVRRRSFHLVWPLVLFLLLLTAGLIVHSRNPSTAPRVKPPAESTRREDSPPPEEVHGAVPVQLPTTSRTDVVPTAPSLKPELPAAKETKEIEIRIKIAGDDGAPIPFTDAEIFATNNSWDGIRRTKHQTDEQGGFLYRSRPYARIAVTAHPAGFHRSQYLQNLGDGSTVDPTASKEHVLALTKGGDVFEGLAVDDRGYALQRQTLKFHPQYLYRTEFSKAPLPPNLPQGEANPEARLFLEDAIVQTDDHGRFKATGLSAVETYLVGQVREGREEISIPIGRLSKATPTLVFPR